MSGIVLKFPRHGRHVRTLRGKVARNSKVICDLRQVLASFTIAGQRPGGMPRSLQELTVDSGSPRAAETSMVPPRLSMTSLAVADMGADIVRNPRTSQAFATGEQTFSLGNDQIALMGETVNSIANRLIRTRVALGYMEQVDFCREIGVARNVYNPFEKAKRRISLDVAIKIRDRFQDRGITLDWIYCGDATRVSSKVYRQIVGAG